MYGFWNKKDEDDGSLVNKIDGLAKLVGIVGAGIATRPYWSKLLGRGSVEIAKSLNGRLSGITPLSALTSVFDDEFSSFYEFGKNIRKQVASTITRKERSNLFFSRVRDHVTADSANIFDSIQDEIKPFISVFGKIGDIEDTDVDNIVLNSRAMRRLKTVMEDRGVKFNNTFQREYKKVMESIVMETSKISASQESINAYLSSEGNQKELIKAFEQFWTKGQKKSRVLKKFVSVPSRYKEITGADLLSDEGIIKEVNHYLKNIGIDSSEGSSDSVNTILQKIKGSWFNKDIGIFSSSQNEFESFFNEKLKQTSTGLYRDRETGKVFSMARFKKEAAGVADALLDELQLPLVPFKFNVPLRAFKFMSPTKEIMRSLGNVGMEPELRRELSSIGYTKNQIGTLQGFGLDDKLLTFSEQGTIKYHQNDIGRIVSYERRRNQNISKLLQTRSQDIKSPNQYIRDLGVAEDGYSTFQRKLYNLMPKISELHYDVNEQGFRIRPKSSSNLIHSAGVAAIYPQNELVDIEDIHPTQLVSWLTSQNPTDLSKVDPHNLKYIYRYLLSESSHERIDLSSYLRTLSDKMPGESPFTKFALRLLENAGDPRKIRGVLEDLQASDEKLYNQVAPQMYRAIQVFTSRPETLFEVTQGESGFLNKQIADFIGHKGIGPGKEKFQEALLSQVIRENAIDDLGTEVGKFGTESKEIIHALSLIKDNAVAGNVDLFQGFNSPELLHKRFLKLGLIDETGAYDNRLPTFIQSLFEKDTINRETLGKFAVASANPETFVRSWLDSSSNVRIQSKIVQDMSEALNALDFMNDSGGINAHNQILRELSGALNLTESLGQRFSTSKPWLPKDRLLEPLNINSFYTVTSRSPNLLETLDSPRDLVQAVQEGYSRKFGVIDFLAGLSNPEKALGSFGAAVQALITMPQNIASEIGLGLKGQDRLTALRAVTGFYGKRVFPLIAGYEAYKNLNANLHSVGMMGLDDIAANSIANINLMGASIKDALGITSFNQWAVGTFPGLDQYFSPRSRDEYADYLKSGNEAVRESRGWMIGSRTPLMGGRVKYFRPNFYRRWTSHWTEADNVDISNPYYSFLPNLQNPIAPLSLLINPDWWVEKHRSDRPYIPGGTGASTKNGFAWDDNYISMSANGFPGGAIGEIGGGYPASMVSPNSVLYDSRNSSFVTGSQGTGGMGGLSGSWESGATGSYTGKNQFFDFNLDSVGSPVRLAIHKGIAQNEIDRHTPVDYLTDSIRLLRTQSGLYGAMLSRMPFYPEDYNGLGVQDPRNVRSFSRVAWMGEYGELTGPAGEFFRRFISPDTESYDSYNPLPNNMPSWLPEKYQSGDPYKRLPGIGELQLPGDAWERTHPWVTPLRVRGSSIGLSEKELIQKWINPIEGIEDTDSENILEFGSAVHKQIQRQLRKIGALVGAEVSIYDKENNISGTVDAIVRGAQGNEILEIKTQGSKNWGSVPDKYIDQLTFYMATTGIHRGTLAFVNRDNPQEVRFHNVEFDPYRWEGIVGRIERARATMTGLVDKGLVSPFESYDLVSRIEILSKAAPNSSQFREHVEFALKGGLNTQENHRVQQAIKEANQQKEAYNLYPRRYGNDFVKVRATVEDIGSNGEIITDKGVFNLAGVEFDDQAFSFQDPTEVLAEYGIQTGKKIKFSIRKGLWNEEILTDTNTPIIVGNVNKKLVKDGIAQWSDSTTKDPTASYARYGNSIVGGIWEDIVHSDNLITNKFMRVRTALEQFERGEVFGTDKSKWSNPWDTFVVPIANSVASKDPISASIMGGILGAMFARTNSPESRLPNLRKNLAIGGAAIGAGLSLIRMVKEGVKDNLWTPNTYRHQAAFDEYWDILKFIKYSAIAESAKKKAMLYEKVNLDELQDGERQKVGLGPFSILAIDAERKAKNTMYGINIASASLQDTISTLPLRQQQIAQEIVEYGSLEEKQRFYDLLPDAQRRVLGKFLGVSKNEVPDKPILSKYFKTHFLPNVDWAGWDRSVDLEDLETRSASLEDTKIDKPNRAKLSKARAHSNNIPIPRMDNPTVGNIKRQINNLLASGGYHNINVHFNILPSESSIVNVRMDLFDDETNELLDELRN